MASREFTDEHGREWMVWDVHPALAERRRHDRGPPPGVKERRRFAEARVQLRMNMAEGWLAFESKGGERRRLVPIPDVPEDWARASETQLCDWCAIAVPVPARRRLNE